MNLITILNHQFYHIHYGQFLHEKFNNVVSLLITEIRRTLAGHMNEGQHARTVLRVARKSSVVSSQHHIQNAIFSMANWIQAASENVNIRTAIKDVVNH